MADDNLPSSLDSLAQGCRVLGIGEVLGSYDGTLAPDHDGFCPDFAAADEARAAFDEAEPMATHVSAMKSPKHGKRVPDITVRQSDDTTNHTKHARRFLPEPLDSFSHL